MSFTFGSERQLFVALDNLCFYYLSCLSDGNGYDNIKQ